MDLNTLSQRLRLLEIRSRKDVTTLLAGQYRSAFRGSGIEFEEVREYQPGDDIRSIDWNVTARQGRPFVKRFREERELTILFLVDCSASGAFGFSRESLQDLSAQICANLAFSAVKNNDKVGLLLFADTVKKFLPPAKGAAHAMRLLRELLSCQSQGGGTDLKGALEYLGRVLKRRAILFLLSDFLLRPDYQQPLQLLSRRHDVVALPLRDPAMRTLPDLGFAQLRDPETGEAFLLDTRYGPARREYTRRFDQIQEQTLQTLKRCGADTLPLDAGEECTRKLSGFLKRRAQLR